MPANLTPEYKEAEAAYKRAADNKERLECLRAMLRAIPKHKGTDHLQADIKTKMKEITEELAAPKKAGARREPATFIRPEGAAQVVVVGLPNSGKSQIVASVTNASPSVAEYPFTTQTATPGMMEFENIQIQLIDTPPLVAGVAESWLPPTLIRAKSWYVPLCSSVMLTLGGAGWLLNLIQKHLRSPSAFFRVREPSLRPSS